MKYCLLACLLATATAPGEEARRQWPGVTVDTASREVILPAEATGMKAGEPVEFFLITTNSGHGYEALASSPARAADIRAAFDRLGVSPGRAADFSACRFWPKGEPVDVFFEWAAAGGGTRRVRVEELTVPSGTGADAATPGLLYTGSYFFEEPNRTGVTSFAADARDPQAVLANYSEPGALFVPPDSRPQSEAYGSRHANPAHIFPAGVPLRVILKPSAPAGVSRVKEFTWSMTAGSAGPTNPPLFSLRGPDGKLKTDLRLEQALAQIAAEDRDGNLLYITLKPAAAARLGDVRDWYRLIDRIGPARHFRIEPPPEGHLFYKAFVAPDSFRDPRRRSYQPWELDLTRVPARLERREPSDDTSRTNLTSHTLTTVADLASHLPPADDFPVLLVGVPSGWTYGALLEWLAPVFKSGAVIHIFLAP